MKSLSLWAFLSLVVANLAFAQNIKINELHGFGGGAAPVLPGDYIELWNMDPTPVDLTGWTIGTWVGDTGLLTIRTIPATCPSLSNIIPGNCFWVFQEGGTLGGPLTGALAGLRGMAGMPTNFASTSNYGVVLRDPMGNCVDYIYLRRATTAVPVTNPNAGAPACSWTTVNISTSGSGLAHCHRLTNADNNTGADWDDDATANAGTPGFPNTTGLATQTSLGPCMDAPPYPPAAIWESNDAAASLGSPGVSGPTQILNTCPNVVQRVQFQSALTGACWFAALNPAPIVGAGSCPGALGVNLPGGQAINLNLAAPGLTFINAPGGTICIPGFSSFDFPFTAAAGPLTISAQFAVSDPSNPDGLALSAALQINVLAGGLTPLAAPVVTVGDDSFSTIALGGCFSFYGSARTQVFVASNGRWTFGVGSTDFTPTVATARTGPANVGPWCDIAENLTVAGTITTTTPTATTIRTDWVLCPYFGQAALSSTFAIEADVSTGVITIFGVNGFAVYPVTTGATNQQFLGISMGNSLATDGGPTSFLATGSGVPGVLTDMIYTFGQAGTNSPGVATLIFTPISGGALHNAYLWSAL